MYLREGLIMRIWIIYTNS